MLQLPTKKIHPSAVIPKKIDGNLAFDLHCVADEEFYPYNYPGEKDCKKYKLRPGESHIFHTGLQIAIPEGYGVIFKDRSGLGAKHKIHVLAGVIDSSYRGEWMICLVNLGTKMYEFTEGDRIVQAVVLEEYDMEFPEVNELSETWRGEKGFGSSGK